MSEKMLPNECNGCKKTGMSAINCRVIDQVSERLLPLLPCYRANYVTCSVAGGRFVSGAHDFNRPLPTVGVNGTDKGIAKSSSGFSRKLRFEK